MDMMSLRRRVMVNQNKLMTATGNPLTFNTPLTKPLKECVVRFTPKQSGSGTPSPENVREIVGKNGITVVQNGKNLYSRTDGKPDYIPLKKGTVISARGYFRVVMYDENMTQVEYASLSGGVKSGITLKNDVAYIGFNPEQEGYDYQIELGSTATEYEPFTGVETSVSFPAVGKNLCPDISTWESGYINNGGGINPANSTRLEKYSDYIPVDELENYTFSYNADGITEQLWTCICAYDENKEYLTRHASNSDFISRKLIARARFVRLSCRTYGMATEAQFEKSAEPTAYEPFDNTVYGGYVDLVNGEVVAEWTKVDMGERNWAVAWNTFNTAPSNAANNGAGNTPTNIMCDIYPSDINTSATGVGVINKNIRGRANYKHICIRDDDYATAADFKTAVTGHYLAYKLAEPIHYPLSPRTLTTLKGNNVMWSDANGDLIIKYWTR